MAGPPYIIHALDVLPLATEWARLVPPTYDQYPLLYAGAVFNTDLNRFGRIVSCSSSHHPPQPQPDINPHIYSDTHQISVDTMLDLHYVCL